VQDCVQLHGGIGVTWEHDLHLYLRRVTVNRAVLGSPSEHRRRLAVLLGM
jgi:alkylation response protein AidB-like acyl-CoA dehydrogenase